MSRPLYVLAAGQLDGVARRLARAGGNVRPGFAVPAEPWDLTSLRTVLIGTIADAATAVDAVLAAARGTGVAAVADLSTDVGREFLADLERIGPVNNSVDQPADTSTGDALPLAPEQRNLLDRLAAGESIAAAAEAEFLSLRTANRRLAQARDALGVRTTRQAVVEYVRRRGS